MCPVAASPAAEPWQRDRRRFCPGDGRRGLLDRQSWSWLSTQSWMRRGIVIARGLSRGGLCGRGIGYGLAEEDLADVGSAENLASRARDLNPSRNQNVGPVGHTERLECLLLDQQHSCPGVGQTPDLVPEHRPGQLRRQVGGRFVEDENGRLDRKSVV